MSTKQKKIIAFLGIFSAATGLSFTDWAASVIKTSSKVYKAIEEDIEVTKINTITIKNLAHQRDSLVKVFYEKDALKQRKIERLTVRVDSLTDNLKRLRNTHVSDDQCITERLRNLEQR